MLLWTIIRKNCLSIGLLSSTRLNLLTMRPSFELQARLRRLALTASVFPRRLRIPALEGALKRLG